MSSPAKKIRRRLGGRIPIWHLKNMHFRAPLGPIMARISPGRTVKFTSARVMSPPKRLVRPWVFSRNPLLAYA